MMEGLTRRSFLLSSTTLMASGLVFGFRLDGEAVSPGLAANAYIHIDADGKVSFVVHRSEMGQWARTTCVILLAEELRQHPQSITVIQAEGDPRYGDQNTDGSTTTRINWEPLRLAGAKVRELLFKAAHELRGFAIKDLMMGEGVVIHTPSKTAIPFRDLVAKAAKLKVDEHPPLLSDQPKNYFAIGKEWQHFDTPQIVRGAARYGIDVQLPDMVYAIIEREPTKIGAIKTLDDRAAKEVPGVLSVIRIPRLTQPINVGAGVAIVAKTWWAAEKARQALKVTWDTPKDHVLENSQAAKTQLMKRVRAPLPKVKETGDEKLASLATTKLTASFYTPFLVHAQMEPLVATARFASGRLTLWAPHQDPQGARKAIATALKLDIDQVTVNVTLLGGGFGRKSQPDFAVEAALIAREMAGQPVRLQWTREDDLKHGYYHAQASQYLEAGLDKDGHLTSWLHRSCFPSIMELFTPGGAKEHGAFELEMGLTNQPYAIPYQRMEAEVYKTNLRVGWYRAVCENFHSFAVNSFMDQIAEKLARDPIEFRLNLFKDGPAPKAKDQPSFNSRRMRSVVELVRRQSDWEQTKPGRFRGFACHYSFFSYVACVAYGTMIQGKFRVTQVHIAADCGIAVNPDGIRSQLEGAVIFGLSHTFYGAITAQDGVIQQGNYDTYPVLRMDETPEIFVHIAPSTENPTGIGEPGVPVIAPAVAACYHQATGQRIDELPIKPMT